IQLSRNCVFESASHRVPPTTQGSPTKLPKNIRRPAPIAFSRFLPETLSHREKRNRGVPFWKGRESDQPMHPPLRGVILPTKAGKSTAHVIFLWEQLRAITQAAD